MLHPNRTEGFKVLKDIPKWWAVGWPSFSLCISRVVVSLLLLRMLLFLILNCIWFDTTGISQLCRAKDKKAKKIHKNDSYSYFSFVVGTSSAISIIHGEWVFIVSGLAMNFWSTNGAIVKLFTRMVSFQQRGKKENCTQVLKPILASWS